MSKRIVIERKLRGWSQRYVDNMIGINDGYYSRLERGRRNASPETIEALEKAFNLTWDELMSENIAIDSASDNKEEVKVAKKVKGKKTKAVKNTTESVVVNDIIMIHPDVSYGKLLCSIIISFPKRMVESGNNRRVIVNLYEHGANVNLYKTNNTVVEYCNISSDDNKRIVQALETASYKLQSDLMACYDMKGNPTPYTNTKMTQFVLDVKDMKNMTLREIMEGSIKIYEE